MLVNGTTVQNSALMELYDVVGGTCPYIVADPSSAGDETAKMLPLKI